MSNISCKLFGCKYKPFREFGVVVIECIRCQRHPIDPTEYENLLWHYGLVTKFDKFDKIQSAKNSLIDYYKKEISNLQT